jgi:hypothetical protein
MNSEAITATGVTSPKCQAVRGVEPRPAAQETATESVTQRFAPNQRACQVVSRTFGK